MKQFLFFVLCPFFVQIFSQGDRNLQKNKTTISDREVSFIGEPDIKGLAQSFYAALLEYILSDIQGGEEK